MRWRETYEIEYEPRKEVKLVEVKENDVRVRRVEWRIFLKDDRIFAEIVEGGEKEKFEIPLPLEKAWFLDARLIPVIGLHGAKRAMNLIRREILVLRNPDYILDILPEDWR